MDVTPKTNPDSPWHAGELTIQQRAGAVERMVVVGERQLARDWMPDQHREFYQQLPFVVLGAVDLQGEVWPTLRAARPGFMQSPVPNRLTLALPRDRQDPADAGMEDGDGIGMLGIELHTRRRNRMNGNIRRANDEGFEIEVTQAYGNCPQYIQLRQFRFTDEKPGEVTVSTRLDERARALISASDSFYVASYVERNGKRQVDASHRGGKPGFVRISEDGTLTIPDFSGNKFFNTLGNMLVNPRVGMVFVDFRTGDMLQMIGRGEVDLDSPEITAFVGAERLWRFKPMRIVYRPAALSLRWVDVQDGASPVALLTGNWDDAAARLKAAELGRTWRPFRVTRVEDESSVIRSFRLEPADGNAMVAPLAGQHLPVRAQPAGVTEPLIRTYTISSAPRDPFLRISVKREGVFSTHLHDTLKEGDIIEARAPAGSFVIDASVRRPAVLLAAGVGITPLLAMASHVIQEGVRTRYTRPTWLFQSAKDKAQRAFDAELAQRVQAGGGALKLIRALGSPEGAEADKDYELAGRIDIELLKKTLPFNDYDFYLCGPGQFTQQLYDGLRAMNIADARIHAESFGPSGLKRRPDESAAPAAPLAPVATESVPVQFMGSAMQAQWTPKTGSLLDLAELNGVTPEFSCRTGTCGTCRTKVKAGAVTYEIAPEMKVGADEALICCARPAAGSEPIVLDL